MGYNILRNGKSIGTHINIKDEEDKIEGKREDKQEQTSQKTNNVWDPDFGMNVNNCTLLDNNICIQKN